MGDAHHHHHHHHHHHSHIDLQDPRNRALSYVDVCVLCVLVPDPSPFKSAAVSVLDFWQKDVQRASVATTTATTTTTTTTTAIEAKGTLNGSYTAAAAPPPPPPPSSSSSSSSSSSAIIAGRSQQHSSCCVGEDAVAHFKASSCLGQARTLTPGMKMRIYDPHILAAPRAGRDGAGEDIIVSTPTGSTTAAATATTTGTNSKKEHKMPQGCRFAIIRTGCWEPLSSHPHHY